MLVTAVFFAGYGWGYKDGDAARRERLFTELIRLIESVSWDAVGGSGAVGVGGSICPPDDNPFGAYSEDDPFGASPGDPPGDDPFAGNPFE